MSVFSTLLDTMLPTRAFNQRVSALPDRRSRLKYWALRIALAIVALAVLSLFGIIQHRQLQ